MPQDETASFASLPRIHWPTADRADDDDTVLTVADDASLWMLLTQPGANLPIRSSSFVEPPLFWSHTYRAGGCAILGHTPQRVSTQLAPLVRPAALSSSQSAAQPPIHVRREHTADARLHCVCGEHAAELHSRQRRRASAIGHSARQTRLTLSEYPHTHTTRTSPRSTAAHGRSDSHEHSPNGSAPLSPLLPSQATSPLCDHPCSSIIPHPPPSPAAALTHSPAIPRVTVATHRACAHSQHRFLLCSILFLLWRSLAWHRRSDGIHLRHFSSEACVRVHGHLRERHRCFVSPSCSFGT